MEEVLGHPATCPHGFPIPPPGGDTVPPPPRLTALAPGAAATVAITASTDPAVVAHLAELGITRGVEVRVKERGATGDPMVLEVDGHERTLVHTIARRLSAVSPG